MNRVKSYAAFGLAWIVIAIGVLCAVSLFSTPRLMPLDYVTGLGMLIVFHPTFDYWLKVSKRFLNIKP